MMNRGGKENVVHIVDEDETPLSGAGVRLVLGWTNKYLKRTLGSVSCACYRSL